MPTIEELGVPVVFPGRGGEHPRGLGARGHCGRAGSAACAFTSGLSASTVPTVSAEQALFNARPNAVDISDLINRSITGGRFVEAGGSA